MRGKRYFGFAMITMLALVVSACGGAATSEPTEPAETPAAAIEPNGTTDAAETPAATERPYEGQKLVVGVWGGPHEEVIKKHIEGPLKEMGAEIELVLGGTGDRFARLYAEKGNPTMDIAFLNLYEARQVIEDGVAQDVDPSIPNFAKLYPKAQEYGYGSSFMALGIAYNPETVSKPITQWSDLWTEELKGKIAFPQFPGFEAESFLSVAGLAFGKTEKDYEDNFAKLEELKPIPMSYFNVDELALEMTNGTVAAAPTFNYIANLLIQQGAPIEFVYPDNPGPVMAKNTMVIAEGTKHEALAKEFVNRFLDEAVLADLAAIGYYGPTNKEVVLDDELASKVVYGEDAVEQLVKLDWLYIIEQRAQWTQLWNERILTE